MPEADWVAEQLAARGTTVVSVDYRLAPVPTGLGRLPVGRRAAAIDYPAASDDMLAAWSWTVDNAAACGSTRSAWRSAAPAPAATSPPVRRCGSSSAAVHASRPRACSPTRRCSRCSRRRMPRSAPRSTRSPRPTGSGPETVRAMYENYLGGPIDDAPARGDPRARDARRPRGVPADAHDQRRRRRAPRLGRGLRRVARGRRASDRGRHRAGHRARPSEPPAGARGIRHPRSHRDPPRLSVPRRRSLRSTSPPLPPHSPGRHQPPQKESSHDQPDRLRAHRPVESPRRRPEEHELRRRQHVGEGHRDRPGHRRAGRAAVGQGLGRRPRHAEGVGPRGAAPRPHARARRRLPRRRARGRDGRRVRLLPARQGRRRAVDRHRDARPRRRRARRPPAPRLGHRDRDRRRRRGAHREDLRREGRVGAVASPRLPARPRHRRDQGEEPAGDRLHPRRPRHHGVGRHVRGGRGELALDHRDRRRPTSTRTARPTRSAGVRAGFEALPEAERRAKAAALAPTIRGLASHDKPMVGHFTDADVVLDFLASEQRAGARRSSAPAAPTTSCAPRSSRCCSTCPRRPPSRSDRAAEGAARGVPRRLPGVLRRPRDRRQPRDPRRRPAHRADARASACSRTAPTSRPPGSPASSTSTRST